MHRSDDDGDSFDDDAISSYRDTNSSGVRRKRKGSKANSGRKPPGLRHISQHVINAIKSSNQDLTYKEMSDLVTNENGERFARLMTSRKDMSVNQNNIRIADLEESPQNRRALENYRRRIYDAWSVLRAANIIEPSDRKRFRYNREVLDSVVDSSSQGSQFDMNSGRSNRLYETSEGSFLSKSSSLNLDTCSPFSTAKSVTSQESFDNRDVY